MLNNHDEEYLNLVKHKLNELEKINYFPYYTTQKAIKLFGTVMALMNKGNYPTTSR